MNLLRRLFRRRPRWQGQLRHTQWRHITAPVTLPPELWYRVGEDWHRAEQIGLEMPGSLSSGYVVKVEFQSVPDETESDT